MSSKKLLVSLVLLTVFLLIGTFIADSTMTKNKYYSDYEVKWGIPKGIGEMGVEKIQQSPGHYRFEYSGKTSGGGLWGDRILRRIVFAGKDKKPMEHTGTNHPNRPSIMVFKYDASGDLSTIEYQNARGETYRIFHGGEIDEMGTTGLENDPFKEEKERLDAIFNSYIMSIRRALENRRIKEMVQSSDYIILTSLLAQKRNDLMSAVSAEGIQKVEEDLNDIRDKMVELFYGIAVKVIDRDIADFLAQEGASRWSENDVERFLKTLREINPNSPRIKELEIKRDIALPLVNAEMAAKNEKWSDALIYALEVFKLDPGHTRALQIEKQARVGILVQSIEAARNRAEIAVRDQSWKAAEDEWEKVNEYAQEIFQLEPQHPEAMILATRSEMWKPLVEAWTAWRDGKSEEAEKLADGFYEIYHKINEEDQDNYILERQSVENLKSDIVVEKNKSPNQDEFVKEVLSELYKQGLINQNEYANWSKREDLSKNADNELKSKFVFVGKNFRTLKQKYGSNVARRSAYKECTDWGCMLVDKKTFKNEKAEKSFLKAFDKEYQAWKNSQ